MQELWQEYRETRDKAVRDRLILTYAPLVKYVAGRLGSSLPAHVDEGDLVSYGLLGLIGAIERYDPDRDIKFETYAIARIRGAIIDELRALDWVPRSVRSRARQIERAIGELEAKLGRAPTDEEIAAKVGVTVEELDNSLTDISRSSIAALDELWSVSGDGDQVSLLDTLEDDNISQPAEVLDETETREALADAIARLPEREKLVVTLYYYEELTLREIGEVLGVTESRVSQLHTKAILRLKSRLSGVAARSCVARRHALPSALIRIGTDAAGAGQDPQRRRRRPPRHGKDLARRGDALPDRGDEPPRCRRGGHDGRRLGRGGAAAADVARRDPLPRRLAWSQDQPARHAGRQRLPGRHDRRTPRRRRRARRRLRRDGSRGEHVARLAAGREPRALAGRLREHARPRARRLLPHAGRAPGAAVGALRRDPASDRRRARADRDRRPPPQLRLHGSRGRSRRGARTDPVRDRGDRRQIPREAARRRRRDRRGADGALPRRRGARPEGRGGRAQDSGHERRALSGLVRGRDKEPRHTLAARPARRRRALSRTRAVALRWRRHGGVRVQDGRRSVRRPHLVLPRLLRRGDAGLEPRQRPRPRKRAAWRADDAAGQGA